MHELELFSERCLMNHRKVNYSNVVSEDINAWISVSAFAAGIWSDSSNISKMKECR